MHKISLGWILTAAATLGCGDSTGSGAARLTVTVTDAPIDILESATVQIGDVEIIPAEGAPVLLTNDGGTHDLLALQNGVTGNVASLEIEAGRYLQLRLVVQSASVTLKEGFEFSDGSRVKDLVVPSGAQSGIKINLDASDGDANNAGINISPGETILVIDFDVSQNFKVQGNADTPASINGFLFTPLLRAVVRDVAGSIAGTLTGESVQGITVTAEQTESGLQEALQTATATALTDATGAYTIRFLAPGTYTVTVDGRTATPTSQSITVGAAESVTAVDFSVSQ